jgi:hypothetical protein
LAGVEDDDPDDGFDDSKEGIQKRAEAFIKELERIRRVGTAKIGRHPNFDPAKDESARSAYRLMRSLSREKITGTRDRAFRIITSLLYEVLSGEQDADLKRACDAVLADPFPFFGKVQTRSKYLSGSVPTKRMR